MDALALRLDPSSFKIPEHWDYDKSVKKVKRFIYKWKNLTKETFVELWIAREKLAPQAEGAGRPKKGVTKVTRYSWSQYCKDIGNSRQVVDRWLYRVLGPVNLLEHNPADDKIPHIRKPIVRKRDLWLLGRHILICNDSIDPSTIELLFQDQRADMCFTSPPYNLGKKKRYINYADSMSHKDYVGFLADFTALALIGCEYVFVNLQQLTPNKRDIIDYLHTCKKYFADVIIWDKKTPMPCGQEYICKTRFEYVFVFSRDGSRNRKISAVPFKGVSNVVCIKSLQDKEYSDTNKATFPVAFARHFIKNFSSPRHIVYDPFVGTGSTLMACEEQDRVCFAVEIDPHNCDITIKRWEKYTKKKARLCVRNNVIVDKDK